MSEYRVNVDVCDLETLVGSQASDGTFKLRSNPNVVRVEVIAEHGPAGDNPNVDLIADNRRVLTRWLVKNGYELDVHPIERR